MTEEYYYELFEKISYKDKEALRDFLRSSRSENFRSSVNRSALIIESPRWKIVFYSKEDFERAIKALSSGDVVGVRKEKL